MNGFYFRSSGTIQLSNGRRHKLCHCLDNFRMESVDGEGDRAGYKTAFPEVKDF